jgi:hypothetical protein
LNITSDWSFSFSCDAVRNDQGGLGAVSYDIFLIGVKNLVINRWGVAVV